MNRHRDGLQGVKCRVVTSRGSGSGTRVRILEVEEARRWKEKKWFWAASKMGLKGNCNGLANRLLRGRFKARLAMYLVKLV
jgi:hypothetical protein